MNKPALRTYLDEEDKSLLAVIQKVENGYIARFERHLTYPVEKVLVCPQRLFIRES